MELDSVKGNISWQHFVKLSNAAKVRNAGFSVPFRTAGSVENGKTDNTAGNIGLKRGNSILSGYTNKTPQKRTEILGQNFDSYA